MQVIITMRRNASNHDDAETQPGYRCSSYCFAGWPMLCTKNIALISTSGLESAIGFLFFFLWWTWIEDLHTVVITIIDKTDTFEILSMFLLLHSLARPR
jgi:hypothetical protein